MLDPRRQARILQSIKKLVLTHHINIAGINYGGWVKRVDEQTPHLLGAEPDAFESGVRELLSALGTSHTAFYHSRPREFLPQLTINATLQDLSQAAGESWMFVDVFEDGPAHTAGIRPGDILEAVNGIACGPEEVPSFAIGNTHTLTVRKPGGGSPRREIVVQVPNCKGTRQRPPLVEPKSPIHRILPPDIGLLKIPYFPGAFGIKFARALGNAVQDLIEQGCERLIVDLRGNIGGSLGFARLASYLCPGKVAIGYSLTPRRLRNGYDPEKLPRVPMPGSRAELLITLARFSFRDKSVMLLTQGLGGQPFHKRIALLVNEWTNSAAEMVASFAAENGLATIIGRKTRGNVLGAMNFKVGGGYWLRLPIFGWFTARGQTLEQTGVDPDVAVDISPQALAICEDNQLAKAIEIVTTL